ncbi:unnamed protein product [Symbiodinium sp. CCMP2592]|nr:unnamed protein product [Symbiodinium sp. CCMP2592]
MMVSAARLRAASRAAGRPTVTARLHQALAQPSKEGTAQVGGLLQLLEQRGLEFSPVNVSMALHRLGTLGCRETAVLLPLLDHASRCCKHFDFQGLANIS